MPKYLAVLEEFFGRAGGFVVGALLITSLTSLLLLTHHIGEATWQAVCLGSWGAVVGGGAISAFRPK